MNQTQSRRHPLAFTLIELLVVIGIITVLIGILLPVLGRARDQAVTLKCLSQMRQLGLAFVMYANDNKGFLPSSDTCGPMYPAGYKNANGSQLFPSISTARTWIGWVDGGPSLASITNGSIYPYVKNSKIYLCPADTNPFRVRSYSANAFINTGDGGWWITNAYKVYKTTQVTNSAKALMLCEESDPRGSSGVAAPPADQWNQGGWYENPSIADSFSGYKDTWSDLIATWHRGGSNFAFVDGHAESWRYSDRRTKALYNGNPTWPLNRQSQANNVDLNLIRGQVVTWKQQRPAQ